MFQCNRIELNGLLRDTSKFMISIETIEAFRNNSHLLDSTFCTLVSEVLVADAKKVPLARLIAFNANMEKSFDQLSACARKLRNLNQVHAIYVSDLRRQYENFCEDNPERVEQLQEPQRKEINSWIASLEQCAKEQYARLIDAIKVANQLTNVLCEQCCKLKDDLATLRKWLILNIQKKVKIWKSLLEADLTQSVIVLTNGNKHLNDLEEKIVQMEQPNKDIIALHADFAANLKKNLHSK